MKTLLPSGCYDVIPPLAAQEGRISSEIMSLFSAYGYENVAPTMLEYSDNLLSGRGEALSSQMFRVMDPLAHRVMAIRPDITLQISRIAATTLKNAPRPLRLCYNGLILRLQGDKLRNDRQLHQTGVELIGVSAVEADAEIIIMALRTLDKIGVINFTIDLNLPSIIPALLVDEALSADELRALYSALAHKNLSALAAMKLKNGKALVKLVEGSGAADLAIAALNNLDLPAVPRALCDNLMAIFEQIKLHKPQGCNINIDVTESRGYAYHSGIGFTIFTPQSAHEIGRGGRYRMDGEEAVGFTLYVETLRDLLPAANDPDKIMVAYNTPTEVFKELQSKGYITINQLPEFGDLKQQAALLGCKFIYENNKIIDVLL